MANVNNDNIIQGIPSKTGINPPIINAKTSRTMNGQIINAAQQTPLARKLMK